MITLLFSCTFLQLYLFLEKKRSQRRQLHQQPKIGSKNHIVLIPILLLKGDISWYHSKLLHRCIVKGSVHPNYKKTHFLTYFL